MGSFHAVCVLAIPSRRAGMERHIHGRGIGLAPHLPDAALRACLPRDLPRARGDGAADIVRSIFGKRLARINRPAAEIERVDITGQARKAGFRDRYPMPSESSQLLEFGRIKLDWGEAARQGLVEPSLDSFVEDGIELAASQR